jgi:hypothetical protein
MGSPASVVGWYLGPDACCSIDSRIAPAKAFTGLQVKGQWTHQEPMQWTEAADATLMCSFYLQHQNI